MEYLVTMTTHIPEGTTPESVDDVRAREATRSRELAAEGHLVRLWRPPLQPGEWRTLGVFAADDEVELEKVLSSMPLRIWRTDEVTQLSPHRNDPAPPRSTSNSGAATGADFLTEFVTTVPGGVDARTVESTEVQEAQSAREFAEKGHLVRLWTLPGASRALGLWRVKDGAELDEILRSLPLYPWMRIVTTPLTEHPNDPALTEVVDRW